MAEKRLRTKELRTWSEEDLRAKLEALRRELWDARLKAKAGSLPQPHTLGMMRRQIARLHTVLDEARTTKGS